MASVDIKDVFKELERLLTVETQGACDAARRAAAEVFQRAAKQAAPVGTGNKPGHQPGQLKKSVKIIEGRPDAYGERRMYVGPVRKTGYYGRFIEHGHLTTGPHRKKIRPYVPGRVSRQREVIQRDVPARPWFEPAVKRVEIEARMAAEETFYRVMKLKGA